MTRKPKWWNVDWVELGCRGWNIDVRGACCRERWHQTNGGSVYLHRDTLQVSMWGTSGFVARMMTDLVEAGIFRIKEESDGVWEQVFDFTGAGYPGVGHAGVTTAGTAAGVTRLRIVD